MDNKAKGKNYEELARNFLIDNGVTILETNYRFHNKEEIDIIGRVSDIVFGKSITYLVFFEVKFRSSDKCGTAAEQVTFSKQKKISRAADYYLLEHHLPQSTPIRFDVIAIDGPSTTWLPNAFMYVPR